MKTGKGYILDGMKIAMAYIGTVIGAGFATGQEILQFFTCLGSKSTWAILIASFFFIYIGHKILTLGFKHRARSYSILIKEVFGLASPLVSIYLAISYILFCGAMFAGGGALFAEHWGIPYFIGATLTALLTLMVTIFGVKGILNANTILVPVIILFSLTIFLFVWRQDIFTAGILAGTDETLSTTLKAGITYASFNLVMSIGVLAPMGGAIKDRRSLYIGSGMGGGLLGLLLLTSNYSLIQYAPEIFHKEIPLLLIVQNMGRGFTFFFVFVIWLGIFTTAIGNLFAINTVLQERLKVNSVVPAIAVTLLGLVICILGFSNIVAWFYPTLGIIGFILVGMILFKTWKYT